jgi:RNA polymerase sigma-70 factor (ECF subfamily)
MKQHDTPRNRYSRRAAAAPELRSAAVPSPAVPSGTPLAERSDEELFELYQAGTERAFEEIVARYEPQILGFLHRRLRDEERVRELAQDTFLRVHRARDRYDSGRKFSTWIFTIANNLLKNEFRNRSRRRETPFSQLGAPSDPAPRAPELEARGPDPEQVAYRGELREAIDRAIEQLDEHHRVPFVMREVEDRTYEEIAEALGVPVGTIKSRLFRARTAFQSLFPQPAFGTG